MSARKRRRQLLLSTATVLSALTGYGSRAYAQCAPATTPSGPVVTCAGGPFNTPVVVDNTANANESLAVSTTAAFQVNVNAIANNALTITGNGAVSFIDPYSDSYLLSADGNGLSITSTGDITTPATDGSIYVNSQGKFEGNNGDGIYAYNNGGGTIDIRTYGQYVRGSERGIFATTGGSDVTITTGASTEVYGASTGISIEHYGAGAINITANGTVSGDSYSGIYAIHSGTYDTSNINVTTGANANVTGYGNGIETYHAGNGSTVIMANGEVTGTYYSGIYAANGANAKDLTVTTGSGSTITGYNSGIKTYNAGTGSTVITANGEVTGTYANSSTYGIYATNGATAKDLTVTAGEGSMVSGYYTSVRVLNNGTGSTNVNVNGSVSQTAPAYGDAIVVDSYGSTTNLTITVGTSGSVEGTGNGIITRHFGTGNTEIVVNGTVTGRDYDAIYATNYGASLKVTTGAGSTVTGGFNGISADNSGGSGTH